MSNVINWLKGNSIYIVTLVTHGDPDNHMEHTKSQSPCQQWIFESTEHAFKACQMIIAEISEVMQESGIEIKEMPELRNNELGWIISIIDKSDNTEQYRMYMSHFEKQQNRWE